MKKRVVVTGLGMISPLGQAQPTWKRLLNKESGIVSFPSDSPSKVAATIPTKVKQLLKNDKQLSPFMQYAMFAAHEALQDANWFPTELIDKEQTVDVLNKGVCIGSGIGSMEEIVQAQEILLKSGMKRISPFFVPRLLVNLAGMIE
jgi:3-oxoacyl-[acyl-carrier-protein] synthase II